MLKNCNYTLVRLLHDLSRIQWYLQNHAKKDTKDEEGHELCHAVYTDLEKDLKKYTEKLRMAVEGLSKEGKFR